MNKYLITFTLSILSITSQAEVWIQTRICNKTGRDITLYKPRSADNPTYANKDNNSSWWRLGGGPWRMFEDERSSNYDGYVNDITIPSTADCSDINTVKKITIYDNNGGGNWDYMTLCDWDNNCKYGQYSIQFYNPSNSDNAGVLPGYVYWDDNGNRKFCDEENEQPCKKFTQHAETACYYPGKNIYRCFVKFF